MLHTLDNQEQVLIVKCISVHQVYKLQACLRSGSLKNTFLPKHSEKFKDLPDLPSAAHVKNEFSISNLGT